MYLLRCNKAQPTTNFLSLKLVENKIGENRQIRSEQGQLKYFYRKERERVRESAKTGTDQSEGDVCPPLSHIF